MPLETRSLVVACLLDAALLGAVALYFSWRRPGTRGLGLWGFAMLGVTAGLAGIALRGAIPDLVSTAGANTLLAAAVALMIRSLRRMRGLDPRDPWSWALVGVVLAVMLFYSRPELDYRARALAVSAALVLLFWRGALIVGRDVPAECERSFRFSQFVLLAALAATAVRALGALIGTGSGLLAPNVVNPATFLFYMALLTASTLGMLWMQIELLQRDLVRLAREDALTGALNRRALLDEFEREMSRAQREGTPLGLAILDIDRFKRVNDRYGHPVGDAVLRAVVDRVRDNLRRHDLVGRYGGEEFAVLMPATGKDEAIRVIERIREQVEAVGARVGDLQVAVTVSAGVATYPDNGKDWDALLSAADEALYAAKESGRNRVMPARALREAPAAVRGLAR